MSKAKRLTRIKRVADLRKAKPMSTTPTPNDISWVTNHTFWVSRDRDADGALATTINVWLVSPTFSRVSDGSFQWLAPNCMVRLSEGPSDPYVGFWSLEECQKYVGTTPDDERQVIRRGNVDPNIIW